MVATLAASARFARPAATLLAGASSSAGASASSSRIFAAPALSNSIRLPNHSSRREFSSTSIKSSSSESAPSPSSSTPTPKLSWDRYLRLRKQRRLSGLATTIPTTFLAGSTAASYFLTAEIDPTQSIAGIDPLYIHILTTIACTGLGYLVGPSLGSGVWALINRDKVKEMQAKDAEFYKHIQKCRVDPSRSNMQNPIPDYYAEKVGSLKEYRRWLRDCSVYRRKAAHGIKEDQPEGGI